MGNIDPYINPPIRWSDAALNELQHNIEEAPEHRPHCSGNCDEGRECWRMNLMSQEEADRRGIKLLTEDEINDLIIGNNPHE